MHIPLTSHPGKWPPGKRLSGKVTIRESSFRETSYPGKWPPGKRLSGKRLSGKKTIRESNHPGNDRIPLVTGRYTVVSRMVTFPDGFFPGNTFPGKTIPGWSLSRKVVSRVIIFPDETFPGITSWMVGLMFNCSMTRLKSYRTTILRIFKWI